MGFVRAGLELGAQVRAGEVAEPDVVLVSWGSGGTVAGLSMGMALAGLRSHIWAVSAVERWWATQTRLRTLQRAVAGVLRQHGLTLPEGFTPCPVLFDLGQIGPGYGVGTARSSAACEMSEPLGVSIEPIYTGKTLAALLQNPKRWAGKRVLYWHTARGNDLKPRPDWAARLPESMQRLRVRPQGGPDARRRRLLKAGAAVVATGGLVGYRACGYGGLPDFVGVCLSEREAHIVMAAAEAILPPAVVQAGAELAPWPLGLRVARNVDRYVAGLPAAMQVEIHLMLALVEHGTPLGLQLRRLSRLPLGGRLALLDALGARGGLLGQVYRGLRDLCLLGYYQEPVSWGALAYAGPWVPAAAAARGSEAEGRYRALCARTGDRPRAWVSDEVDA